MAETVADLASAFEEQVSQALEHEGIDWKMRNGLLEFIVDVSHRPSLILQNTGRLPTREAEAAARARNRRLHEQQEHRRREEEV